MFGMNMGVAQGPPTVGSKPGETVKPTRNLLAADPAGGSEESVEVIDSLGVKPGPGFSGLTALAGSTPPKSNIATIAVHAKFFFIYSAIFRVWFRAKCNPDLKTHSSPNFSHFEWLLK
jgi:hypothetical protein